IALVEAQGLHDADGGIDLLDRRRNRAVHEAIEGRAVRRLIAGSIHENDLRTGTGDDARDTQPRRLGFRRHDAHLLTHQPVEKRGLPHVGAADDRDVACPVLRRIVRRGWQAHRRLAPLPALRCAGWCPRPASVSAARESRTPPRTVARVPRRASPPPSTAAAQSGAPAGIPATASWGPWPTSQD